MIGGTKPVNQPAKLAERALAPGDGEAEPGVTATSSREPAKLATDGAGVLCSEQAKVQDVFARSSVAHFVGWDPLLGSFSRLYYKNLRSLPNGSGLIADVYRNKRTNSRSNLPVSSRSCLSYRVPYCLPYQYCTPALPRGGIAQ